MEAGAGGGVQDRPRPGMAADEPTGMYLWRVLNTATRLRATEHVRNPQIQNYDFNNNVEYLSAPVFHSEIP